MSTFGIIGGTGVTRLEGLEIVKRQVVHTPYGEPSGPFTRGRLFGQEIVFLARHGYRHNIPPHKINYRANLWAFHHLGIRDIIAFAAVGGITEAMQPRRIVIPDQIIDYTYSRHQTYFEEDLSHVTHIDFTEPYCPELRRRILAAVEAEGIDDAVDHGTYAAMQGPRLETAAEIDRLERDGCDIVGMTGMPEAALARELGLCYATIAIVANRAAGRGDGEITMDAIRDNIARAAEKGRRILRCLLAQAG